MVLNKRHISGEGVDNGRERLLNLSRSLNENCLLSHLLSYATVHHKLVDKWNMTTTKDLLTMADIPPNDSVDVLIYGIRLEALEIVTKVNKRNNFLVIICKFVV